MQEEKPKYTKLSNLVGEQFTIERVYGWKYKKWDNNAKRMLVSDTYEQGYRKIYGVVTDKGTMDLGAGQLGNLLEAVLKDGVADLNGRTFAVKSNGKEGMDIRYFFNPVKRSAPQQDTVVDDFDTNEEVSLDDIPFN